MVFWQKPFDAAGDGEILEKIEISDQLRSKCGPGASFKVGNCYYDTDGDFLYRIV